MKKEAQITLPGVVAHLRLRTQGVFAGTGAAAQLSTELERTRCLNRCGKAALGSLTSNRTLKVSHRRSGGAELSTSLSLSQATYGSRGSLLPPRRKSHQAQGREQPCSGGWFWLAPAGNTSQKPFLECKISQLRDLNYWQKIKGTLGNSSFIAFSLKNSWAFLKQLFQ